MAELPAYETTVMKTSLPAILRGHTSAQALLFALALLAWSSANAQNFVRNPDFEQELGPDNWTIVYTEILNPTTLSWPKTCGSNDFFVLGRSRMAHKDLVPGTWDGDPNYWNKFGLHFQPGHDWLMHAYASQVISGLQPGSNYTASAWITQYEGDQTGKVQLYMEVLGGPDFTVSNRTPYVTTIVLDNPSGWNRYDVTGTASPSGQIEIRLHYNKNGATAGEKWRNMIGIFDHVCLKPTGQGDYLPPYSIVSMTRNNQDIALTWESVMNNSYRLQVTPDLISPTWSFVRWSPYVDTNLYATGPTLTFRTNLVSLLSYDPSFDPTAPLYFRVFSQSFKP